MISIVFLSFFLSKSSYTVGREGMGIGIWEYNCFHCNLNKKKSHKHTLPPEIFDGEKNGPCDLRSRHFLSNRAKAEELRT